MRKLYIISSLLFLFASKGNSFSPVILARWAGWGVPIGRELDIYLSTDGGETWEFRTTVDTIHGSDGGLGIGADASSGNVYLVHYRAEIPFDTARFYFSSDTGKTWELRSSMGFPGTYDVASAGLIVPNDTVYSYLLGGFSTSEIRVYKSTDGVYSWTEIGNITVPEAGDDLEGAMEFDSAGRFYIGEWTSASSPPTCYRSIDCGNTWDTAGTISSDPSNNNNRSTAIGCTGINLYAVVWSNLTDLKVYKSIDQGTTWAFLSTILSEHSSDDGVAAIGASVDGSIYVSAWDNDHNTLIFRSDDEGLTWIPAGEIDGHAPTGSASLALSPLKKAAATVEETSNYQLSISNYQLSIYPNPFTRKTEIRFQIPDIRHLTSDSRHLTSDISLRIYDLSGRLVKSFPLIPHPSSLIPAVEWDGKDGNGRKIPNGIYLVRLQTEKSTATRKIVILR